MVSKWLPGAYSGFFTQCNDERFAVPGRVVEQSQKDNLLASAHATKLP